MVFKVPKSVSEGRVRAMVRYLRSYLPAESPLSILDVGCGSGFIAEALSTALPQAEVRGVEIITRPHVAVPITEFDGQTLPFENGSVDVSLLIDVLHHAQRPGDLLQECIRVSRNFVIVKDHLCENAYDRLRLKFLDWLGNRPFDIPMPYTYFSRKEWDTLYDSLGLQSEGQIPQVKLCPAPFHLLLDRSLHLLEKVKPRATSSEHHPLPPNAPDPTK